jgi:N-methylhydantoinase A
MATQTAASPLVEEAAGQDGRRYLIGVDVGGTFTDVVVGTDDGGIRSFKAFSVPSDEAQGILDGLEKAATAMGLELQQLLRATDRFVHGSTVAANALIEKTGSRMAFVNTAGFRDTLIVKRTERENMYDLRAKMPENILRRRDALEIVERTDRDGMAVVPLDDESIDRLVAELAEREVEAVGISLLFSFRNPAHERRVKAAIEDRLPGVYVVASSDVAPEIRDYERASTTALSAYLGPRVARYLGDLETRLRENGLACAVQIVRSSGGVCTIGEARDQPVDMLLSGPAGGVVAAAYASTVQKRDVITFDMGGTSCDLSVVHQGRALRSTYLPRHTRFEGWDVLRPFLDIHALGAGGGSIAWRDDAGGLHVGPRSAGGDPGPACYGRGGQDPTVTDANLALGYLDPANFLDREVMLDADAATAALDRVGGPLGYGTTETAAGIFRIVNSAMADGIRVVMADKGHDPALFDLLCFGGAGGIHASAIAAELGIGRVVVPREAATFSAYGLLLSDVQYDFVTSVVRPLSSLPWERVADAFGEMKSDAAARVREADGVAGAVRFERTADMRYEGQSHELRVEVGAAVSSVEELRRQFENEYLRTYGYLSDPDTIVVVNLRVTAVGTTAKPGTGAANGSRTAGDPASAGSPSGERRAFFEEAGGWLDTPVHTGVDMAPGHEIEGPAIVEFPSTTVVARPGQAVSIDEHHNVVVTNPV